MTAGLARHGLGLASLAAAETRILVRQSLGMLLLGAIMLVVALIAYVALIAAAVTLLAERLAWGWPVSLATAGLIHLALLGILWSFLRRISLPSPYESTARELRRDIEALGGLGNDSSRP